MRLTKYRVVMVFLTVVACVPPRQQLGSTEPSPIPTSCANLVNADTAVYDTTGLTEQPRARVVPPLTYPPEADRAKIRGRVLVAAVVSSTGSVESSSVKVTESVHPLLDQEAVRFVAAASLWPGCRNGQPVRVRVAIPVTFARGGVPSPGTAFMIGLVVGLGGMLGAAIADH
jgi:TonB family protein